MRVPHSRARAAVVASAATMLAFGLISVAAPAASAAPLCALDSSAHTLTVTAQTNGTVIRASGPYLDVNDTHCALLNGVDTVSIDLYIWNYLEFDLSGGPLGPGFTDEGDGSSEIEFEVFKSGGPGARPGWHLDLFGSPADDGIRLGRWTNPFTRVLYGQVNLNALVEGSADADVSFTEFPLDVTIGAGAGNDVVSGEGVVATHLSGPFSAPMVVDDGPGTDQITGGDGDDRLSIDALDSGPDDQLYGGGGNDAISSGGGGSELLEGGSGDDELGGSPTGSQTFRGGEGTDMVYFAGFSQGVYVHLDAYANDGLPGQGSHVETDVENVSGTSYADTLIGDSAANRLDGYLGGDDIRGAAGDDTIVPGAGGTATGGAGRDTLEYTNLFDPITIDVPAHTVRHEAPPYPVESFSTIEVFLGTRAADVFNGGGANDTFLGNTGDDHITGRSGDDSLYGQAGNDAIDGGRGTDLCRQGAGTGTVVNCEA